MTKADLIEALEDVSDDCEIRLMHQQSWPFEYSVFGTWVPEPTKHSTLVTELEDGTIICEECLYNDGLAKPTEGWATGECDRKDDEQSFTPQDNRQHADKEASKLEVLYLVEGTQLGYGSKTAFEECEVY